MDRPCNMVDCSVILLHGGAMILVHTNYAMVLVRTQLNLFGACTTVWQSSP